MNHDRFRPWTAYVSARLLWVTERNRFRGRELRAKWCLRLDGIAVARRLVLSEDRGVNNLGSDRSIP